MVHPLMWRPSIQWKIELMSIEINLRKVTITNKVIGALASVTLLLSASPLCRILVNKDVTSREVHFLGGISYLALPSLNLGYWQRYRLIHLIFVIDLTPKPSGVSWGSRSQDPVEVLRHCIGPVTGWPKVLSSCILKTK